MQLSDYIGKNQTKHRAGAAQTHHLLQSMATVSRYWVEQGNGANLLKQWTHIDFPANLYTSCCVLIGMSVCCCCCFFSLVLLNERTSGKLFERVSKFLKWKPGVISFLLLTTCRFVEWNAPHNSYRRLCVCVRFLSHSPRKLGYQHEHLNLRSEVKWLICHQHGSYYLL